MKLSAEEEQAVNRLLTAVIEFSDAVRVANDLGIEVGLHTLDCSMIHDRVRRIEVSVKLSFVL